MKNELWQIIDTGPKSAYENMRFDSDLLERADTFALPVLHLYEWQAPSATFGHFIEPSQLLDVARASQKGLDLARRPTGGGIIFHMWDMAFSVLMPAHLPEYSTNTLDNYGFVNRAVLGVVQDFLKIEGGNLKLTEQDALSLDPICSHFCMAKPTKYDVLCNGKKVAGAAQRKTKKGFLHQGSISLVLPDQGYLDEVLLPGTSVSKAMQIITCPLLDPSACATQIAKAKEQLRVLLATHLKKASLKYRP